MERQAETTVEPPKDSLDDQRAGLARIIAAVAVAAGFCFLLGVRQGEEWAIEPERGVASEAILLWVLVVLIAVAPAMVIGRSAWPRRRLGLLALIVAMTLAALGGFGLSTGIGGERGFPEDNIAWGILFGLLSTSVGAGFGYEVGSVTRRHVHRSSLPTNERWILYGLGVIVVLLAALVVFASIDAIVFGTS
jgi:hypothetical protein